MNFTTHARERFEYRFSDCPLSIEEAYSQSIPFGAETPSSLYRIHYEYRIVFVIEKACQERYVKTVLTEELYYANIQMLVGSFVCKIEPTRVDPKKLAEERIKRELEEVKFKEKAVQDHKKYLRELGRAFAREKNYCHWQQEFYAEVKSRFGISKKATINEFLPGYLSECSDYTHFNK